LDGETRDRDTRERKGREVDDASQASNREKAQERQFEETDENWKRLTITRKSSWRPKKRETIYYRRSRDQIDQRQRDHRDQRKKRKTGG
jgi:hypothetical protein